MATTGAKGERRAESRANVSIEALRWLQNRYYQLKRAPYHSKDYVRQIFRAPSRVDPVEMNQYQYYTHRYSRRRLIIMAVHLMIAFKYFVYIYYTLSSVDFKKSEKSLEVVLFQNGTFPEVVNNSLPWYRFLCLETNCSRLSSPGSIGRALEGLGSSPVNTYDRQLDERTWDQRTRLAEDLARLPLFALCKSNWRYLRNPHIFTHIFGIVSVSMECFFLIVVCLAAPFYEASTPIHLPLLMSVLCPRINLRQFVQTIGDHWEALLRSQLNHELSDRGEPWLISVMRESDLGYKTLVRRDDPKNIRQTLNRLNSLLEARNSGLLRLENPDKLLSSDTVIPSLDSASQLELLAAGCLPIELTNWFRKKWSKAFATSIVMSLVALLLILSTVNFLLSHDQTMPRIYRSYGQMMERENCSLFVRIEPDQSSPLHLNTSQKTTEIGRLQQIDLDNLVQNWKFLDYLEPPASLGVPAFILVQAICHYYYSVNYLNLTILDMRNQASVIIELGELRLSCPRRLMRHWESFAPAARPMCLIRNRLFEIVSTNLSIVRTKRLLRSNGRRGLSDLDDRLANQEFALDLMTLRGLDLGAYVELLEELQINYRLLMDAIKKNNSSVTICLIFSHLLNYGFVLLGLYLSQAFKEFLVSSVVLGALPLIVANLLISLASNVHARARKLETQLWSLVASTTAFEDMRVKQLRSFWIKQLVAVGTDGGLALKMVGRISVTYALIIEFVFWTSSILVFSVRLIEQRR